MFLRSKRAKWRPALFIAALYAVCVLAPTMAFALSDGSQVAHCFIDDDHPRAAHHHQDHSTSDQHVHAGGPQHDQAKPSGTPAKDSSDASCCGLMGVSALPAVMSAMPFAAVPPTAPVFAKPDQATGRPPDRLYRPPIAFLSAV